mmetsp:Transcript_104862/g.272864  ORF Transcript_104862/g.272864 Transcript_104862/m.272864 type:complete len:317 (+) Transcript_104862:98-1048(+)
MHELCTPPRILGCTKAGGSPSDRLQISVRVVVQFPPRLFCRRPLISAFCRQRASWAASCSPAATCNSKSSRFSLLANGNSHEPWSRRSRGRRRSNHEANSRPSEEGCEALLPAESRRLSGRCSSSVDSDNRASASTEDRLDRCDVSSPSSAAAASSSGWSSGSSSSGSTSAIIRIGTPNTSLGVRHRGAAVAARPERCGGSRGHAALAERTPPPRGASGAGAARSAWQRSASNVVPVKAFWPSACRRAFSAWRPVARSACCKSTTEVTPVLASFQCTTTKSLSFQVGRAARNKLASSVSASSPRTAINITSTDAWV